MIFDFIIAVFSAFANSITLVANSFIDFTNPITSNYLYMNIFLAVVALFLTFQDDELPSILLYIYVISRDLILRGLR